MQEYQKKLGELGIFFEVGCPLSKHSTFHVGGNAECGVFPQSREELVGALLLLRSLDVPFLVIGKGSNVVFSDEGFEGAVVFTEGVKSTLVKGNEIFADAGISLAALATLAAENGLTGLEFAHGIPGTLGGAVFMNAGAYDGCMADVTLASEYLDLETGETVTLVGDAQAFGTRKSYYTDHPSAVILGARILLAPGDRGRIRERMKELSAKRKASQPLEFPSAGSVFKRPVGHYAGKLIEDCGLKGRTVGGAEVSEKHAGFIINRGGATAEDVRALVEEIQKTVLDETGVALECEIRFL